MFQSNKIMVAFVFLLLSASKLLAASEEKQLILNLNNISDYRINFTIIAINQDGSRDTEIDAFKGELQVGQTLELGVVRDSHFDITISCESDESEKQAMQQYGIETFLDITKGGIFSLAGVHNYAINEVYMYQGSALVDDLKGLTFVKIVTGSNDLPRNPNPLNGALNVVTGAGLILKGTANISNIFLKKSSANYILNPLEMKKTTIGLRMLIKNIQSRWRTGISMTPEQFSKIRKGVVRLGATRL